MNKNKISRVLLLAALTLLLIILVVIPVLLLLYGSIRSGVPGDPNAEYTARAIKLVYTTTDYLKTLAGTLLMSVVVAAAAVVIGTTFAWVVARTNTPGRSIINLGMIAPLFLSPFLGAIAWRILAAPKTGMLNGLYRSVSGSDGHAINITTLGGIIFVLTLYYAPYCYIFTSSTLGNMDPSLEEASSMSGAGIISTAKNVTLPLMRPAMLSSFFFVTMLTLGIFSVPAALGSAGSFVPLAVRLQRVLAVFPADYSVAAAIGTLILVLTVIGTVFYRYFLKQEHRYVTLGAKNFKRAVLNIGKWKYIALGTGVLYILVSLLLPYAAVIYTSLYGRASLGKGKPSLDPFMDVIGSSAVRDALKNTLYVGLAAPTLTVLIGLAVALVSVRNGSRYTRMLEFVTTLPIGLPGIVLATGMVWAYISTPLYATLWILVLVFIAEYIPHTNRLSSNGLLQIDKSLEEASFVNGASRLRTALRIVLPLNKQAVFAGWILVFLFTVREINSVIVLYAPNTRLISVLSWDFLEYGSLSDAAIVGLIQTLVILAGLFLAKLVLRVRLSTAL